MSAPAAFAKAARGLCLLVLLLRLSGLEGGSAFASLQGRASRVARRVQKGHGGHGQEQWSELRLAELSEALFKLAPQVSSVAAVVTSMVLFGVVSTAPASDWSTNVQVNVAKQQGTSDDGTTWSRVVTTSVRETHVGAPLKELSLAVEKLRTTVDQVELQERLLDELGSAEAGRAWDLERLLWQTWYFHENSVARTLVAEGSSLMDEGDLEMAKQCFLHAATLEPHWAEAWNRLATVDYLLGNYKFSLLEIDKTLELQPRHFGALSGKGLVYLKLERFQKATEAFEDAQEVVPASDSMKRNIDYADAMHKEAMSMRF